ncbi:uncharacterized protein LOC135842273 [Planococcus citri]|uniref:uncharacterized protein LOC135842273 n=1 Tax=Planococcus citri TaxID=170843 RepID=UPI0031F8D53B
MLLSGRFKFFSLVQFIVMYMGLFRNLPAICGAPEMRSGGNNLIEHQVTSDEAKQAVKDIEPDKMITVGCKSCSRVDIQYCLSDDVISDHCCCDRKFKERFPYIEHTCTLEDSPCQPVARDCSEYTRIVDCCCNQQLASKWKANYLKSCASRPQAPPIYESILSSYNLLVQYINVIFA